MGLATKHLLPITAFFCSFLFLDWLFCLALVEVFDPNRSFAHQFWISLGGTVTVGAASLVLTRCRGFCARLADVEEAITLRRSRTLESRKCRFICCILFWIYATLTVVIACAWFHFQGT